MPESGPLIPATRSSSQSPGHHTSTSLDFLVSVVNSAVYKYVYKCKMKCNYYYSLELLYSFFRLKMALRNVTVVLGTKRLSNVHLERKQVQKIIIHKDYKPSHLDSDLSLLLLATPVQFTNFKMPICLQKKERIWDRCWMAEWVTAYEYGMCLPFKNIESSHLGFPGQDSMMLWKIQV